MAQIRLLLIEDDEDDFIITRDLLSEIRDFKFKLDWVSDIVTAKETLAKNEHHVCLMDYSLGSIDGISLLKEAPVLGFTGPIIMLTGQDSSDLDREAMTAGAVDFLVKAPLTTSRLARAIRYAISRQETETARIERQKAVASNRAKSVFLAHLSHELRTPLTAILGYADILLSDDSVAKRKDYLRIIKQNGDHLLGLLNDVLDLSKIEAGKLEIENSKFDLHRLLNDIHQLMLVKARDKQLGFQFVSANGLPRYIRSDPTRLKQILLNLLSNAIKFTNEGNVTLTAEFDSSGNRPLLIVSVTDTGIGITSDEIQQIFQPFSQSRHSPSPTEAGTGLGLAISQRLTERMNGSISVRSKPGKGSTFTIKLRIDAVGDLTLLPLDLGTVDYSEHTAIRQYYHGHVLVVDDVTEIRDLIGYIMTSSGLKVSYAEDGIDALKRLEELNAAGVQVDVAIIDMQMPKMSGLELVERIARTHPDLPCIALTASIMKGQRELCLNAGFKDHLAKPVDVSSLMECVSQFVVPCETNENAETETEAEGIPENDSTQEADTSGPTILLVEDNQSARESTTLLLRALHCRVHAASNGREAVSMAKQLPIDAVITDLNLPDINGFQVTEKIRRYTGRSVKIIGLSGQDLSTSQKQCFDGFYLKPLTLDGLKNLLKTLPV